MSELLRYLGQQIRAAEDAASKVYEPTIGLVVDNRDPEGLGRVKLRFPTLPGGDASAWAVCSGLGAGQDRGWWFLPEIDAEVLVVFEHGDVSRPIVLGTLFNGVDKPPTATGQQRVVRSRGGSQLTLDDERGTLTIEDGGGLGRIVVDRAGVMTIEATSGDVELQATEGTLSIVAREIDLRAGEQLILHADGQVAIGAASGDLRGGAISVTAATLNLNPPGGVRAPATATAAEPDELLPGRVSTEVEPADA